ncbi:hypothetical protein [Bordetella sp. LUAb4]|uniref:hypothetical protein n=1 Tax=Bordetella sp. LUAb4 TaxID=2843195 RepID=UPI001E58A10C|nr:hypothetical protein [Bordetella sp. LUAb4]
MFPCSIGSDNAVPRIALDASVHRTAQTATDGAMSFEGRPGASRAVLRLGRAPQQEVFDLRAGFRQDPTLAMRATPAEQAGPLRMEAPAFSVRATPVHEELAEALIKSDIDWSALCDYWNEDTGHIGPEVDAITSRIFDEASRELVGAHNEALWNRTLNALLILRRTSSHKALTAIAAIANRAIWAAAICKWDGLVQGTGPTGLEGTVLQRDLPDIGVLAWKIHLVNDAFEREAAKLQHASYCSPVPLRLSALGRSALHRAEPLLQARLVIAETSTGATWFHMMSLDRERPGRHFVNHITRGTLRLQGGYGQQDTDNYSVSDVVLRQLLSCPEIDPAEIATLELVDIDAGLTRWLGANAIAPHGGGSGASIPWQHVPVDRFIRQTREGKLLHELASALGGRIRHAWCFDYIPYARGGPAPEGQPVTVSADKVQADVLVFISPALMW